VLVKGYLLLDQMTSRNLITSSVECECHVNLMVGPVIRTPLLDRMSIQLQFILGSTYVIHFFFIIYLFYFFIILIYAYFSYKTKT
jgi:hypothetical protein